MESVCQKNYETCAIYRMVMAEKYGGDEACRGMTRRRALEHCLTLLEAQARCFSTNFSLLCAREGSRTGPGRDGGGHGEGTGNDARGTGAERPQRPGSSARKRGSLMEKRIARVFPRKTKASPDDELAFFTLPPLLAMPEIDEVHVSVTFTYDLPMAEMLRGSVARCRSAGTDGRACVGRDPADEKIIPGMYLKRGYTITSRGCNNKCWFCMASRREGCLREIAVKDGWDICGTTIFCNAARSTSEKYSKC